MKIAVIGAGNVGGTLGRRFVGAGHDVVFGVRDRADAKVAALLATMKGPGEASAADNRAAAQAATLVVFTTPWEATQQAVESSGPLAGKIVIDATNPLVFGAGGSEGLALGFSTSGGEMVAGWAQGADVFKTFNQVGWEIMADPVIEGRRAVMFVAGSEGKGKQTVIDLVASIGFDALDIGPLSQSRILEPLGQVWIHTAMKMKMGREWAFSVVRRDKR
jgi:8-hydroxy-5-deazaflavin:NADPH oxidoreductase